VLRVFCWNSNQITIIERVLKYHELVKFGFWGATASVRQEYGKRDVYDYYHYIWDAR
jgi:hypothetical protein